MGFFIFCNDECSDSVSVMDHAGSLETSIILEVKPHPGVDGGAINLYSIPIKETAKGYRNAHDIARRIHA